MSEGLTYNATLVDRVDLTVSLAIFRVRPDRPIVRSGSGEPGFFPGQYVVVGLNEDLRHEGTAPRSASRPLSIASAPEDPDALELYVNRVAEPVSPLPLSHLLWRLRPRDRLYMSPVATGRFTLEHTIGRGDRRALLFVAAGTGIAPFMSMIRSRARRDPGGSLEDLALIHGVSRPTSLGYHGELEALREKKGLRYLPTISRPDEAPERWPWALGRADQLLSPVRLAETEARLEARFEPACTAAFVCGLHGTVRETIIHLLARGYVPDHRRLRQALGVPADRASDLFFEKYDTEPAIDTRDPVLMAQLRGFLGAASAVDHR